MKSDDFVARALAHAHQAHQQAAGIGGSNTGQPGGIFVVGSHITIITNVQAPVNSPVAGEAPQAAVAHARIDQP